MFAKSKYRGRWDPKELFEKKGDQKGPTFLRVVQEAEYLYYTQYIADIWAAFAVWSMSKYQNVDDLKAKNGIFTLRGKSFLIFVHFSKSEF